LFLLGSQDSPFFFNDPNAFFWGIFLPIISLFFYWKFSRRLKHTLAMARPTKNMLSFYHVFAYQTSFLLCFGFIVIALAQPVCGKESIQGKSEASEIVICLDLSASMNVKDINNESRLGVAKRMISALVGKLEGQKIGLCIFAGEAIEEVPVTADYSMFEVFLEGIETNYISYQGTNIPEALNLGSQMFSSSKNSKLLILVTDGENHETEESQTLKFIQQQGISFLGIGIGTPDGGKIVLDPNAPEDGYKIDNEGRPIVSGLNQKFIEKLSNELNGTTIIVDEPFPNIDTLMEEVIRLKKTGLSKINFEIQASWYKYAALGALLSLVFWMFILKLVK
jgi:Ca-activated chloride channel family protein